MDQTTGQGITGLPAAFVERLERIIPIEHWEGCLAAFSIRRPVTARINTLKIAREEVFRRLEELGLAYAPVAWYPDVVEIAVEPRALSETDLIKEGLLYVQALSSLLPVLLLDPQPGERVLDLCAAPGSKTTQIAAHMRNEGEIIAVEAIRGRSYRLRSVVQLLGADIVRCKILDGRRFRSAEAFDRILVDAPCSSEGRFQAGDEESFGYWSVRKINEMVGKQRGLLMNAGRLLKPGGTLVYATCTFSPEENEGVLDWFLGKTTEFSIEPVSVPAATYPALAAWEGKTLREGVARAVRILPDRKMEGFFLAKIRKAER